MRFFLRIVCWFKGHGPWDEEIWETMPIGLLVCSRCRKLAPENIQHEHAVWIVKSLTEDEHGLKAEIVRDRR